MLWRISAATQYKNVAKKFFSVTKIIKALWKIPATLQRMDFCSAVERLYCHKELLHCHTEIQ